MLRDVVEHLARLRLAEALAEAVEQLRTPHLVAATLPEELARQRGGRVDINARVPLLLRLLELAPRIHARHIGVDVAQHRATLLAAPLESARLLARDDAVGLRCGLDLLEALDQVDRLDAGRVERGEAGRVPRLREKEPAILACDPAGAPD